jgi:hypothetical protein
MSTLGTATPGTNVPSGASVSPGGPQGVMGVSGNVGANAYTVTATSPFTVPAVGQTVVVTVTDASWVIAGQMVNVAGAAGTGVAGAFQVQSIAGNQLTLLNPTPSPAIPPADSTQAGLLKQLSGNVTDYVGGDNACHNLSSAVVGIVDPLLVPDCGQLSYVSTTALQFVPYKGDLIKINGLLYHIPAGGIAGLANTNVYVGGVAGQNLAGSTVYYVYCFNNAGTLTADFWTAAAGPHSPSATVGNAGVEIRTGDDTRTLIGMVYTGGTPTFFDQLQYRYTRSWFNDWREVFGFTGANTSVTSTASKVLASCIMIGWNGEPYTVNGSAYLSAATVPTSMWFALAAVGGAVAGVGSTNAQTARTANDLYSVGTIAVGNFTADGVLTLNLNGSLTSGTTAMSVNYPTITGMLGGNP